MTVNRAKQILFTYRRSMSVSDPETQEALNLAEQDPELGAWLEQNLKFHEAMSQKFQALPVTAALKNQLLLKRKIVRPAIWWRRPAWAAAVAAVLLGIGLITTVLVNRPSSPAGFAQYQGRMIGTALRQYRMDILSGNMQEVREYLRKEGAPADYELPKGVEHLKLFGAGALKWKGQPVSMVCFKGEDDQMLYVFITHRSGFKDAPDERIAKDHIADLTVMSWTRGDNVYLLAGPPEADFEQKYIQ